MEAWGAARGHQPPLEGGGVGGSLGHTITDDSVCVPALILLFGQTYAENDGGAPTHHRYTNITDAATAAQNVRDRTIFDQGASVFDTMVAARLQTDAKAAVDLMHQANQEFKARVLGAVIRDMAGRPGAFTPALHLKSDFRQRCCTSSALARRCQSCRRRSRASRRRSSMGNEMGNEIDRVASLESLEIAPPLTK